MGNPSAPLKIDFEYLFKSNYTAMYRCAFTILNDHDTAKDIVQEVFFKCWDRRNELHKIEKLSGYLIIATTRTAYNYLRDNKNKINTDIDLEKAKAIMAEVSAQHIEYVELELAVKKAIERLPLQCKTIFQLSRQEGLTYQQIAEALELSVKTVEKQMGIALVKLRESLKPFMVIDFVTLLATFYGGYLLMIDFSGSFGWVA